MFHHVLIVVELWIIWKKTKHFKTRLILFGQMWASTFLILWIWARCVPPVSSQGRSFSQRWPRPHSWPQMWRLKVSWVPMATMRTTRCTPHCCVSLSVFSALWPPSCFCPLLFPYFLFSTFSVSMSPSVALLVYLFYDLIWPAFQRKKIMNWCCWSSSYYIWFFTCLF